jgi:hypothetical protein
VLHGSARRTLARLPAVLAALPDRLLDHGAGRLERTVCLLATDVWPALYSVRALHAADPAAVWRRPKDALLAGLPAEDPLAASARRFAEAPRASHARGGGAALHAFDAGVACLEAARRAAAELAAAGVR